MKRIYEKAINRRFSNLLSRSLKESDPELRSLILKEIDRQRDSINLIASENFASNSVYTVLGTPLQNKYSEVQSKGLSWVPLLWRN